MKEKPKLKRIYRYAVKFTGKMYICPICGAEIEGYIDPYENALEEYAGCVNCVNNWKVEILKRKKEDVNFILS